MCVGGGGQRKFLTQHPKPFKLSPRIAPHCPAAPLKHALKSDGCCTLCTGPLSRPLAVREQHTPHTTHHTARAQGWYYSGTTWHPEYDRPLGPVHYTYTIPRFRVFQNSANTNLRCVLHTSLHGCSGCKAKHVLNP